MVAKKRVFTRLKEQAKEYLKTGASLKSAIILIFSVLAFSLFIIPSASASFGVGNPTNGLNTAYGPSESITGWINISFSSEPLSSVFSDSGNNSINLSKVLNNNAVYPYSCSPVNCGDDYTASSSSQTKTATLISGDSRIYGVKLTGNIFNINSFKFTLDSTAAVSCVNQIEVDLLDDSVLDASNKNSLDSGSCSNLKDYGCFNSGNQVEELNVDTTPYCEKVILSNSPGFFIGGWIKKVSGTKIIKASIYDTLGGGEIANCILPDSSSEGQEISCSVNYSVASPKEHYVCISAVNGSGEYYVRGYSAVNTGCGFHSTPVPSNTPAAYQIFAQGKQFGAVGTMEINKSINDGVSFADLAEEYLIEKYGGLNCPSGCVIPIKITSNLNQDITLRNLEINYDKEIGSTTERNFYEVSKTPAKVTSGFQRLYLDNSGFHVPSSFGNYTFSLKLNGQSVVSEKMEVKEIPVIKSVSPAKAAAGYPTEFIASVTSKNNITGFSWDFGDGSLLVNTLGNKTSHTYGSIGAYNLRISVTDSKQLTASKTFVVNVSSPKELINSSIYEAEKDIANLETELASFSGFYREALNSSLNLNNIKESVVSLKAAYLNSTTDAEYIGIVEELVSLKIPEGIAKSRSAKGLTLFSGPDYVDLSVIQKIAGGTYDTNNEEGYKNGVLLWQSENLDVDMNFDEFSGRYANSIDPLVKIFEIKVNEKKDIPHDYYLILPEMDGFKTDARFSTESGYVYVNLKEDDSVSFSTTEDFDFTNLPAFISPAISKLTVIEEPLPEEKPKWTILVLIISLLLVIGVVGYVIMQEWYRRKYEKHLFPNRNDLYNMVHYVNNAKRKGLKEGDIESNLKKAGWSSEKIRYVMRKYAGKRTGMLEIPITRLAEKAGGKPKGHK